MRRKEFIKRLGLGSLFVPVIAACASEAEDPTSAEEGSCVVSPTETAGPFPSKSPASLVMTDIRSDRTGIVMDVNIIIQNKNNGCEPLAGAVVDIWHCDKDGYYSEYGGTGMQSVNLQSVHFLRGRQTTDSNGLVSFRTIFPGWYSGRAPHIHVHIYDATGQSLLVTQIAFPTEVCNTVYTTATQFYTKGTQDTPNARDNIFSDSIAYQMAAISGSVSEGYVLAHTIVVNG